MTRTPAAASTATGGRAPSTTCSRASPSAAASLKLPQMTLCGPELLDGHLPAELQSTYQPRLHRRAAAPPSGVAAVVPGTATQFPTRTARE